MREKHGSILNRVAYLAAAAAGIYLALRFLLPWTAPLIIAFFGAALIEKPVRWLMQRLQLPRPVSAGACVILLLIFCGGLLWLLAERLVSEVRQLGRMLPETVAALSQRLAALSGRFENFRKELPEELEQLLQSACAGAEEQLLRIPGALSERAVALASGLASALPTVMLFIVTLIMGLYFISAAYPKVTAFLKNLIPSEKAEKILYAKNELQKSIGKYFKAQLIMMAITFFELLAAFFFMRLDYALVAALITAVIDALPVFGVGTVLLPWAAYELLAGDAARGAALAITYGMVTVLRSCIQAKLLGDQLGLSPLATLLCIYAGWRAWGIWGMIVFPIAAISFRQLYDSGLIHKGNSEVENDRSNFQYSGGNGHEYPGSNEHPPG